MRRFPMHFGLSFFGTKHLGSIKAAAFAFMVVGTAIGPTLTGILLDFNISLQRQYLAISAFFIIAFLLIWVGVSKAKKL